MNRSFLSVSTPTGTPGDLSDLPRVERATLIPVELFRLSEDNRNDRKVHSMSNHVGGDDNVGVPRDEPVDLVATGVWR